MTKLQLLKSVEKALCSDILDSFYSVRISGLRDVELQGRYKPYTMEYVNKAFGLSMSDWSISDGGYIQLEIDGSTENKIFMVNEEQLILRITLTN